MVPLHPNRATHNHQHYLCKVHIRAVFADLEAWELSISGSCLNPSIEQQVEFFQASFSSFSDLVLALFPLLII